MDKVSSSQEKGYLLYTVALGMLIILAMLMFISVTLHSNTKNRSQQWAYHGMAMNMARAGLIETLSWLRRNPNANREDGNYRVFEFLDYCNEPTHKESRLNIIDEPYFKRNPRRCSSNHQWRTPASLNPYIGIVREIHLEKDLYGRFEVWDDDLVNVTHSGDLWKVRAIGILCKKKAPDTNFHGVLGDLLEHQNGVAPEVLADKGDVEVLSSVVMETEFRKLTIKPPAAALLVSARRGSWIYLKNKVRLIGPGNEGSAVQYQKNMGHAFTSGNVEIQGFNENSTTHGGQNFGATTEDIFGVDKNTLSSLADISVNSFADLPNPLPQMKLVYLQGNANFTTAKPLQGSGVLFVDGNIKITGTGHSYSGLICSTGSFTNTAITTFYGSIVAGIEMSMFFMSPVINISGLGSDFSEFYYDPMILKDVATRLGVYRMNRSPYVVTAPISQNSTETKPVTWLYGFDKDGDHNKNKIARRWLPPEYP